MLNTFSENSTKGLCRYWCRYHLFFYHILNFFDAESIIFIWNHGFQSFVFSQYVNKRLLSLNVDILYKKHTHILCSPTCFWPISGSLFNVFINYELNCAMYLVSAWLDKLAICNLQNALNASIIVFLNNCHPVSSIPTQHAVWWQLLWDPYLNLLISFLQWGGGEW